MANNHKVRGSSPRGTILEASFRIFGKTKYRPSEAMQLSRGVLEQQAGPLGLTLEVPQFLRLEVPIFT